MTPTKTHTPPPAHPVPTLLPRRAIRLSGGEIAYVDQGGGKGGGSHTTAEWYDATGRELGLKRLFLATVALAGVHP